MNSYNKDDASVVEHAIFSLALVQAVNDYQCGGDSAKKAERLRLLTTDLPTRFRSCSDTCYRQEAHDHKRVWDLIAETKLPMRYSSWTTDLELAKAFKGGVTLNGQGVILQVKPPAGSVILNLMELFGDAEFNSAVKLYESRIARFGDGIGRYKHSQAEVILDLETGASGSIYCLGGFPSDAIELARLRHHREPTSEEIQAMENALREAGTQHAGWWLSPEGSRAVLQRLQAKLPALREKKRLQGEA